MFGLAGHGLGKGGGLPWLQQTIPGDASRHSRKAHCWGRAQGRQQVNPPQVAMGGDGRAAVAGGVRRGWCRGILLALPRLFQEA